MRRFLSSLMALMLCFCIGFSAGCQPEEEKSPFLAENIIEDAYDNYYEIFVYSFYDSNGDGIGDLDGVTSKLEYVRDMGYTGIWLMPIHSSPSYHKYDVEDYYSIDKKYGTLEDFEELIEKAHSLGIKVILDLVVNHTSEDHPWFKQSILAKLRGEESEYLDFYNYSTEMKSGYTKFGSIYYESRFVADMPDLNLDNEAVRAEISAIMKYWLDKGADGFRLDACTSYYTEDGAKSVEFVKWIKEEACKYKKDAYIVGEVWASASTIQDYYTSGADSFFCFPASQVDGYINKTFLSITPANDYYNAVNKINAMSGDYIPAPFLCNHDTGRIAGVVGRKENKVKFAYGLLSMLTGNTFTYYGDEIGMVGSYNDPDKRIGMLWDNAKTNITNAPPGTTTKEYKFDGVKEQMENASSILNYYRLCNNTRNAFPSIMRGTTGRIVYDDDYVLLMKKTYQDEAVTIAINFATETKQVEIAGELAQQLCVGEEKIAQNASTLVMPAYSIAILR